MKKIVTIAIAEDHDLLRQGMLALFKDYDSITVLFDVANGQELLDHLKTGQPDVILLDISMPVMDGGEALRRIKIEYPDIKVIILSSYFENKMIVEYIKIGAHSFLPKNSEIKEIVKAINLVYLEGYYYNAEVSEALAKQVRHLASGVKEEKKINLSEKEEQVFYLLLQNKTSSEIANAMCISARTVEGHRSNILKKTGNKNTSSLINWAFQHNIVFKTSLGIL